MHSFNVGIMIRYRGIEKARWIRKQVRAALRPYDVYEYKTYYRIHCSCRLKGDGPPGSGWQLVHAAADCSECSGRGYLICASNPNGEWADGCYLEPSYADDLAQPVVGEVAPTMPQATGLVLVRPSQVQETMRLDALVTPRGNWIWRHLHHMGLSEDDEWLRRKAVLEMYGDDYVLVRVYARSHATDDDSIVEANPETIALSAQSAREYE